MLRFGFRNPLFELPSETLKGSDDANWVSTTDGDTPKVSMPIRMLGIDSPEYHYMGANQNNPGKFDQAIEGFLVNQGSQLDEELKAFIEPRLQSSPSSRHIASGEAALRHFEQIKKIRLEPGQLHNETRRVDRKLYIMVAQEVFDKNGRMLAYVNAAYNKEERQSIPLEQRPTFNLQMVQEGHAVSLLIYPNIPKPQDLTWLQAAGALARQGAAGFWAEGKEQVLLAYEFRWIVDTIGGRRSGPDRYCGDILTGKLYPPQHYFKVLPENRLFFREEHRNKALELGFEAV